MSLGEARRAVFEDRTLRGQAFVEAYSDVVDQWLAELFLDSVGERDDMALVAVGGYGRRSLAPYSDLDLLLLHADVADIAEAAERLWYPIWDTGAKLGHAVRTVDETLTLAADDLDTATSLLSARHLVGASALTDSLASQAGERWHDNGASWIPALAVSVKERHLTHDEVAFMLEPDLKDGRGGLRDVHALRWADKATPTPAGLDEDELQRSHETLLAARVELHRAAGRGGDRLLLEWQDAVADALDIGDADELMAEVASAARRIAWHSDEVWTRLLDQVKAKRRTLRRRPVVVGGPGVTVQDGRAVLDTSFPIDPESVLRLAAAAAHHDARIAPQTIARLEAGELHVPAEAWTPELRRLFVHLLRAGPAAIPIVETLDQLGMFVPYVPEWAPARSRPQRNAYHRFTVDRHLWETAAEAARLVEHVERPDLLVIGALLHDIGKPYPGDHTEVGIQLVSQIGRRMGFNERDVEVLVAMCRHHLLLPDVATRLDLHDEGTIKMVVDAVGSVEVLHLLHALTVADSIATGPAAWSAWKAGLVRDLANRTEFALRGGDTNELPRNFPTLEQRDEMRTGVSSVQGEGDTLTVFEIDRPGVFNRIAGAVSLSGLDVMEAAAFTEAGMAVSVFRVRPSLGGEIDWPRVCRTAEQALAGRLAIAARIADRVRTYGSTAINTSPQRIVSTAVSFDNDMSSSATVITVSAPNGIGLLYQITRAFGALDLDISNAKVQTLGEDVVDSFYVRDRSGDKIYDQAYLAEIERALRHAIDRTFAPLEDRHG